MLLSCVLFLPFLPISLSSYFLSNPPNHLWHLSISILLLLFKPVISPSLIQSRSPFLVFYLLLFPHIFYCINHRSSSSALSKRPPLLPSTFFPSCRRFLFPLQSLSCSFSFCDSVGIYPCLCCCSISTLSSAKCDLFCSSSLQHNHAVFVACQETGRRGKTGKKSEKREWDKGTKQTSRAGISWPPLSYFSSLWLVLIGAICRMLNVIPGSWGPATKLNWIQSTCIWRQDSTINFYYTLICLQAPFKPLKVGLLCLCK